MRLASHTDPTFLPLWTLDGSEVIFSRAELGNGSLGIYRVPADGSRPAQRVANGLASMMTPDGNSLINILSHGRDILSFNRSDSTDFWLLPLEDPASASLLLAGQSTQFPDGMSPDGNYLLYVSNVSGQFTLYLTRYPSMSGRWQVSPDGNAGSASFSADGTVIYYESEKVIYAVDFESGDNPSLGPPRQVLELPATSLDGAVRSRDGETFLIVQKAESEDAETDGPNRQGIKLVQNWTAGIR
jgi:Tol biopolymer transport system component